MNENDLEPKRSSTLWERLKMGFIEAHHRRPISFYLLLLMPVVLLLGAHIFQGTISLRRFTLMLALILAFLWVVCAWAINDLFTLWKKHRADNRAVYMETIGDPEFATKLGRQVKKRQNPH